MRSHPLVVITVRTRLVLMQTSLHIDVTIDDSLLARVTSVDGTDGVLRSIAAIHAVGMARFTLAIVGVFTVRACFGTKWSITHVFAGCTVVSAWSVACRITFAVTRLAQLGSLLVNASDGVAVMQTVAAELEVFA